MALINDLWVDDEKYKSIVEAAAAADVADSVGVESDDETVKCSCWSMIVVVVGDGDDDTTKVKVKKRNVIRRTTPDDVVKCFVVENLDVGGSCLCP